MLDVLNPPAADGIRTPHSYTNGQGAKPRRGNKTPAIAGDDPFTYMASGNRGAVQVAAHRRATARPIEMVKWWGLPTRGRACLIRGDDPFICIDTGTTGGGRVEVRVVVGGGGACSAGEKPAYRSRRLLQAHWWSGEMWIEGVEPQMQLLVEGQSNTVINCRFLYVIICWGWELGGSRTLTSNLL